MAGKWLAKLSNDLRVKVGTLSRACNGRLLGAFDELLPFVGLWTAFKLGSLHRILPMGAYEVLKCQAISCLMLIVTGVDPLPKPHSTFLVPYP